MEGECGRVAEWECPCPCPAPCPFPACPLCAWPEPKPRIAMVARPAAPRNNRKLYRSMCRSGRWWRGGEGLQECAQARPAATPELFCRVPPTTASVDGRLDRDRKTEMSRCLLQ